jgi:hypothetical protein
MSSTAEIPKVDLHSDINNTSRNEVVKTRVSFFISIIHSFLIFVLRSLKLPNKQLNYTKLINQKQVKTFSIIEDLVIILICHQVRTVNELKLLNQC